MSAMDALMSMKLSDFDILNITSTDYSCIHSEINKIEAINVMQNIDLTKKDATL